MGAASDPIDLAVMLKRQQQRGWGATDRSKSSKLFAALRSAKSPGVAFGVVAQAPSPNASAATAPRSMDQITDATTSTMTTRPTSASMLLLVMPAS